MSARSSSSQVSRPIANFHPCRWGDHFLNFTPHHEATQNEMKQEVEQLKEEVKKEFLATADKPLEQLNLIDTLERLGVAYHFEEEIEEALQQAYDTYQNQCEQDDLYHVSLRFRILRQHGFYVPSDVFNKFKNEEASFKEAIINDIPGLLSLYEASHVRVHGDDILNEALAFTTSRLKSMEEQVGHALDQPLHKGVNRLEARHYISVYEQDPLHNKTLLKFAKLDFDLLQKMHKKELRDLTSWWKGLHLKLPFSRDRSAEAYFWILGTYYEPKYALARKIFSKLFKLVSLVDDTYDAYGTIEELELLTDAVLRWDDISSMDQLPDHVKWCYQALLETFKEVEHELAQDGRSLDGVQYAKEQMKKLCQAYLKEAKWSHEKHIPTYSEYMEIGLLTSGFPFGIVASFLGMGEIATKEAFEWVCQNDPMPKPVRASATINRLLNDVGGHQFEQNRNHVASSVQIHVARHGALSEEHANEALKNIVEDAWKELNHAMLRPFAIPKPLVARVLNLARVSGVIYNGEDGYTNVSQAMKDRVAAVLVDPIPI